MLNYVLFIFFPLFNVVFATGELDALISKGKWFVDKADSCPDPEQYPYDLHLQKRKVNRTHDGFNAIIDLDEEITEDNVGFALETCKKMDGGCKLMHIYEDKSLCRIIAKYGKENFERGLVNMGLEPHCPIPPGHYTLNDFIFDNREMPDEGMVGSYEASVWVTKDGAKMTCILLHVTFISEDDLEDDYDNDDYDDDENE